MSDGGHIARGDFERGYGYADLHVNSMREPASLGESSGMGNALIDRGRGLAGDADTPRTWTLEREIWRLWALLNPYPQIPVDGVSGVCDGHKSETGAKLRCGHWVTGLPCARIPDSLPCRECAG